METNDKRVLARLRDPKSYLEKFTKIKGKKAGKLIDFVLNDPQKHLFNALRKYKRIMILKARQLGFSTGVTGFFYHDTITTPGVTTALIGYNSDLTAELLDKIKTLYKTTPAELRPTIHYNSKYEISFPRLDSKILVLPSSENVGRGYTIHNCLVTELSSWEKAEEKMMQLEASVPINGRLVIESTPRGQGNLYHKMWMSDNDYQKLEYGWWWGYSEEEIAIIERRMNNPLMFAQEYGLDFLSSGRPAIPAEIVKRQRANVKKVDEEFKDADGDSQKVFVWRDLRIYCPPKEGHYYIFGADTSEGIEGGDYSSVVVLDRSTGEEVAFFRGLVAPDILGNKLNEWGRWYNEALMAVEVNNHGLTTLTILKQQLYPNLYFRPAKFETLGMPTSDKMGWKTTKMTKPLMIDDLVQILRNNSLTIHSKELLDEMTIMVYNDAGDVVAISGYHDDCFMAACVCFQGFKVMYHKALTQLDYTQHLPTNFSY